MEFKELLQRYHVSPLRYEDGTELVEKDYKNLYLILKKYFIAQKMILNKDEPAISQNLISKAEKNNECSLISPDVEDIMDILMEQKGGIVHAENESC